MTLAQPYFQFDRLTPHDRALAENILDGLRAPNLLIAPNDKPYLYRWHIVRNTECSVYFHIQVASDGGRDLHDHPWDNTSVILAGGYDETLSLIEGKPDEKTTAVFPRKPGDVIHRLARQAHRLDLPRMTPYTMTLFSTGPRINHWGFWAPDGFVPYEQITEIVNGVSRHVDKSTP